MTQSDFVLVVNQGSGSHDAAVIDDVDTALVERGASVEQVATGDAEELADVLRNHEGRTIVICGGDGSVHLTVGVARSLGVLADRTFGVLPLGTGNDLAGHLRLPTDPADVAGLLCNGDPKPMDLMADDAGGVVVNVVHAGLGAEASATAAPLKSTAGPLAYPIGALIAGITESGWTATVAIDGRPLVEHTQVLMVAAGIASTIGGGTPVLPTAEVDDGRIEVMVSTDVGPGERAAFAAALRQGEHVEREGVLVASGTSVTISGQPMRHCADGEIGDEVPARTYEIQPQAWSLIRP